MHLPRHTPSSLHRRTFLGQSALGLGGLALSHLLQPTLLQAKERADSTIGCVLPVHKPAKVKRAIFLYMAGGPSQFETLDPKPALAKLDGQPMPTSFTEGKPIAQLQGQKLVCLRPLFPFQKFGQSGQEMTTLFPHTAKLADELCIVRSLHTDQINHDPAHTVMNTGTAISGRPSLGAWLTYGLGCEAANLPGFVVLISTGGRNPQPLSSRQWHNGFLPSQHQGVELRSVGDPVLYLQNPAGVGPTLQRDVLDTASALNRLQQRVVADPEISTRISQYELAYQMQMSVPELMDFRDEPKHILQMYGTTGADGTYAGNCLLARRLAERGVRFIQLYHRGWDHHNDLKKFMEMCAGFTDQPTAALLRDLKQRGMLDDTLVLWGGEFGRTPMAQSNKGGAGRDHHMQAFSMWLAGGGVRAGTTFGGTDELGYHAVDNPVHVHDLHATMLHLFGIEHTQLTYRFQGRDFRLTDVAGKVVHPLLA